MKWAAALGALLATAACHSPPPRHVRATTIRDCDYHVELTGEGRADVRVTCNADGPVSFAPASPGLLASVCGPVAKKGRYPAPGNQLSYEVDLAELASRRRDVDRALKVGTSFVATMSSVLLVPEPLTTEIPVKVTVRVPPPLSAAVGLARDPAAADRYTLMAHEIPVATYFAFGRLQQRALQVGGSRLEVTLPDGALDRTFNELSQWLQTSAQAVSDFYGTFPVPRASVFMVPLPGRASVVFGKVLPESEPGIALLVGQHAPAEALYSDWILVHELFHLGFPSFFGEGKWLDEGLATYYEPIIRVRAGLYTEQEFWEELESSMPQGLPAFTELGLEHADDFRGIYWGGAIACLLADVRARQRALGSGLEVGLRALREAGGNASQVWSLAETIGAIDHALGAPTLAPIAAAHAERGSRFDLRALFDELGVTRNPAGKLQLSDAAPLSAVRRAITARP